MSRKKYIIGVDLGGTKILSAIVTTSGKIKSKINLPTEAHRGSSVVIRNIKRSIQKLLNDSCVPVSRIKAIGIGAPGPILYEKGIILNPPNLPGWKRVSLKKIIEDEFRKKVVLDNDANAAALGEFVFGAAKGKKNFIYITVSTGIGGGIIINGEPYRGSIGGAGEIGHMIIKEGGPKCRCGNLGCLEAMTSGTAIARRAKEEVSKNKGSLILKLAGGRRKEISAEIVGRAAKLGDKSALKVINEAAYYLGIGLSNLVNIFSPDMIGLGGGIMKTGNLLLKPIKQTVRKLALSPAKEHVKIVRTKLKENIGILGAAALCIRGDG